MLDRFSPPWKDVIFFPLLERISLGDIICMNGINYSYLFPFNLFRTEILDYIPFAMLSCNEGNSYIPK